MYNFESLIGKYLVKGPENPNVISLDYPMWVALVNQPAISGVWEFPRDVFNALRPESRMDFIMGLIMGGIPSKFDEESTEDLFTWQVLEGEIVVDTEAEFEAMLTWFYNDIVARYNM